MTKYQIAKWIVEHEGCETNFDWISCIGASGVNRGTFPCPLKCGDFNCDNFGSPKEAAQAWLDAHKEEV